MVQQFAITQGLTLDVVDYQKTPLSPPQLSALRDQLGTPAREMVRDNEGEYQELNLAAADDAVLLAALADHPKLLQRPIVVYRGKAMIGRPPEKLADLLQAT